MPRGPTPNPPPRQVFDLSLQLNSVQMTAQLALSIVEQENSVNIDQGQIDQVKFDIKAQREKFYMENTSSYCNNSLQLLPDRWN